MKLLHAVDNQILAFWFTAPNDRLWAYLATFVPVAALISGIAAELF